MNKRAPTTAPLRPLDLETLDRVIGGCRMAVVPERSVVSGLEIAAADAWSSLGSIGSAFAHDRLAADFMRGGLDGAVRPETLAQAGLLDDVSRPHVDGLPDKLIGGVGAMNAGAMDDGNRPALHCGTMEIPPIDAPGRDGTDGAVTVEAGDAGDIADDEATPPVMQCGTEAPPAVCGSDAPLYLEPPMYLDEDDTTPTTTTPTTTTPPTTTATIL